MALVFDQQLISETVRKVHESPYSVVVASTGAGLGLLGMLWDEAGLSQTLLEGITPYKPRALQEFIGAVPKQYAANETACAMASAAYRRARELMILDGDMHPKVLGVAITGAVATDRPKKGDHRVHVAVCDDSGFHVVSAIFEKGLLSRVEEGMLCDLIGLAAIFARTVYNQDNDEELPDLIPHGSGITSNQIFGAGLHPHDQCVVLPDKVAKLVGNDGPHLLHLQPQVSDIFEKPLYWADGTRGTAADLDPKRHLLYSGSFNPRHFAHHKSAKQAASMTDLLVVHEMTASHPDKGDVRDELARRLEQFRWDAPVIVTQGASLFIEKARQFPAFGMLMGVDAVKGLLKPQYYGGVDQLNEVLREFSRLGTRFYVTGRTDRDTGRFETLRDVYIAADFSDLFIEVNGRWDCASRDLR